MDSSDNLSGEGDDGSTAVAPGSSTGEPIVRRRYDDAEDGVEIAIVEAVAAANGADASDTTAMRPLYESVDTEALATVLTDPPTEPLAEATRVSFTYEACRVSVDSNGVVEVTQSR